MMNYNLSRFTLLASVCLTLVFNGYTQKKLLVLGSSTSACWGPSIPANCYLNRLAYYYNNPVPSMMSIENRAAAGFNVYKSMPRNFKPPIGRDSSLPYYSITDALAVNPDAVLINYPSNNYDIYSVAEVMFCLRTIKEVVNQTGKPCYITTSQPRTSFDAAGREKLRILKDSILYQFGASALDFWSGLNDPISLAIAAPYQVTGDPVHLNDEAHNILFQRVLGKNLFNTILPDAGLDQLITLPQSSVLLDASRSVAPGSSISSYSWSVVNGPAGAMITTANAKITTVAGLLQGLYTFRLTVTSASGLISSDDILVRVNPGATQQPPIANAGKDETIPVGQATVLHGEGSTSPSGTIKAYLWTKISGPAEYELLTSTSSSSWVRNMTAGIYIFKLTITDINGLSATDEVVITVTGINTAPVISMSPVPSTSPVAQAGPDLMITLPISGVTIDGSQSTAPGSFLKNFVWSYVSGPSSYYIHTPIAPVTEIKNLVAGLYTFRLTVTNYEGVTAYDDVVITVKPVAVNQIIANAGKDETIPPGQSTVLHGESSTAPGGIKSYYWTKVSGPTNYEILTPNAASTWIRNMVTGTYIYRLTVTDWYGVTADDDVQITVTTNTISPVLSVIANAGKDETIPLGQATVLHGENSSAPGGRIVSYVWTKYSGPSNFEIISPNAASTWIRNMVTGTYIYRLTVTDDKGITSFDDVAIIVTPNLPIVNQYMPGSSNRLNIGQGIEQPGFYFYPNPVINHLRITLNVPVNGEGKIYLIDAKGSIVRMLSFNKDQQFYTNQLDVSGLMQGTYTIEVSLKNRSSFMGKFIKF